MKLIIDIPDDVYERMMNGDLPIYMAYKYVKNGTPLDDIKAEIERFSTIDENGFKHIGTMLAMDIIYKHIRKESE